jgi:hypothetical protein
LDSSGIQIPAVLTVTAVFTVAAVLGGCGSSAGGGSTSAPNSAAAPSPASAIGAWSPPAINPANFVSRVDNPYLPLPPGTTLRYRGAHEQIKLVSVTHH